MKCIKPNMPFVDYDAVQEITLLLIRAAMKKQVVMFDQVVAACQNTDHDQCIRGNISRDKDSGPTSENVVNALTVVANELRAKGWPPLTVLVTKDGKNVAQGFWTNTPVGDVSMLSDEQKRAIELTLRKECLAFFDPFSAMSTHLNEFLATVNKAIEASADEFPILNRRIDEFYREVVNGGARPLTLSQAHAKMVGRIRLTPDMSRVISYDSELFPDVKEPETNEVTLLFPVGETVENFLKDAREQAGVSLDTPFSIKNMSITGVYDTRHRPMSFQGGKFEYTPIMGTGQSWKAVGYVEAPIDHLSANLYAVADIHKETIQFDTAHGGIASVMVKITLSF